MKKRRTILTIGYLRFDVTYCPCGSLETLIRFFKNAKEINTTWVSSQSCLQITGFQPVDLKLETVEIFEEEKRECEKELIGCDQEQPTTQEEESK